MLIPCFNTIGVPDWTIERTVEFAHAHKFNWIEIRGLENTLDLRNLDCFANPKSLDRTKSLLEMNQVQILSLNLSYRLWEYSEDQAEEIVHLARLAHQLGVRYLRFFPGGKLDSGEAMARLVHNGNCIVDLLAKHGVQPLVETHDSLVHSNDILAFWAGTSAQFDVIWDFAHTINEGMEHWQSTLDRLQPCIRYLHVKDILATSNGGNSTLLLEGVLPVHEILSFLDQDPGNHIVSFEWEKLWHPELADGENAISDYGRKLRRWTGKYRENTDGESLPTITR